MARPDEPLSRVPLLLLRRPWHYPKVQGSPVCLCCCLSVYRGPPVPPRSRTRIRLSTLASPHEKKRRPCLSHPIHPSEGGLAFTLRHHIAECPLKDLSSIEMIRILRRSRDHGLPWASVGAAFSPGPGRVPSLSTKRPPYRRCGASPYVCAGFPSPSGWPAQMVPASCPDQRETLVDVYDVDCREARQRPIMEMVWSNLLN
jgi:hypothetical protein